MHYFCLKLSKIFWGAGSPDIAPYILPPRPLFEISGSAPGVRLCWVAGWVCDPIWQTALRSCKSGFTIIASYTYTFNLSFSSSQFSHVADQKLIMNMWCSKQRVSSACSADTGREGEWCHELQEIF